MHNVNGSMTLTLSLKKNPHGEAMPALALITCNSRKSRLGLLYDLGLLSSPVLWCLG